MTDKQLGEPPKGATHLLVVADHLKVVPESNEDDNVKPLTDVKLAS